MTSDYERSTKAMTFAALPAPLRDAVRTRAEADLLTLPDSAPAYLTHSRKLKRPGLLSRLTKSADPDAEHLTAFVLGDRDVLVCTHGDRRGTSVLVTRLEDATIGDAFGLASDGLSLDGFPTASDGVAARGSFWVGLGAPDGDAARAALEDAIRRAKAA